MNTADAGNEQPLLRARGLRLSGLMVVGAVTLVVLVMASSGVLQVIATSREFQESSREQNTRLQSQARETGKSIARLVSMTGARSLRDNDYGALAELAKSTVANDPSVLRTRILDADGNPAADTDPTPGGKWKPTADDQVLPGFYKGQQVYEYQLPITYSGTKPNGFVVLTYSLELLQAEMQRLDLAKRASIEQTTRRTVALALLFVALSGLLVALAARRITRPLAALTDTAMQLAQGNLGARVDVRGGGREVRTLAAVFNHMAEQLEQSANLAWRKEGLENEMNLARRVQESLLPDRTAYEFGRLRVAGLVVPADECGGDWWLRVPLDDHRISVGIGDVTGHGLPTALIATSALSAFSAVITTHHPDHVDAELLIQALNQTLFHVGHGEYQMSCAMMVFDLTRSEFAFANGGHPFPCAFSRQTGQVGSAVARGPLVGKADAFECKAVALPLRAGDVYVWYSDGLLETRDAGGQAYGFRRLSAAVQQWGALPAEQLRDAIIEDVNAFSGGLAQEDDLTVVVAECVA